MSAFVVGTDHIDYLVTAAIDLGRYGHPPIRWQRWSGGHPGPSSVRVDLSVADELGAMLLAENIASVVYRYPDCTLDDLPGTATTPTPSDYHYQEFRPFRGRELPEITRVLTALASFEYQSCEHPAWEASEAKRICDRIRAGYLRRLPGFGTADAWSIRRPTAAR